MNKKIALLLAGLMAISVMSGCTGGGKESSTSKGSTTSSSTSTSSTTSVDGSTAVENTGEMDGNMYLTGLPIVKEKETFTVFCDDSGVAEDKIIYELLEEQTNVHVDLNLMPYEAAKEKLNILLNSGDYPDVIGGWLLGDKDILQMGMRDGTFIELDGLFKDHSPKIEEILDLEGVRNTMTLPDGHIYTIPYVAGEPLTTFNPWINVEWLDKLGLEMPTTTEEFKEVLIAFRDNDPNGNGEKDEIPFSADPDNKHIGVMAGYFGIDVSAWTEPRYYTMVDGKPVFGGAQEGFKEFMIWFADLYKEGLVDPELFTQDKAQWRAKGNENLYGVSIAYGSSEFAVKDESADADWTVRRTEYEPLPVLKSGFVDTPTYRRQTVAVAKDSYTGSPVGVTTFRTQAVITDKAENPAMIVRFYDNLFQLENSLMCNYGPLGYRFEKTEDGEYRELEEKLLSEEDRDTYNWGKIYTQSMPKYLPAGYSALPPEGAEKEYNENLKRDEIYEPFLGENMPKFWMEDADSSRYTIIQTDLDTYMKKTIAEWATGQKDVAAEWDNHLKALDSLGLPEIQKIIETALDKS